MAFENTEQFKKLQTDLKGLQSSFGDVAKQTGFFERTNTLDQFDNSFQSVGEGEQFGSKKVQIGGQDVTLNAFRGATDPGTGATSKRFDFVLPSGKTLSRTSQRALGATENFGFLNDVIRGVVGGESAGLKLGTNEGGFDANIQALAGLRGLDPKTFLAQADSSEPGALPSLRPVDQADFKIASGPITAGEETFSKGNIKVTIGEETAPGSGVFKTNLGDFSKEDLEAQGFTADKVEKTDTLIDINDIGDTEAEPVIQKSTDMNNQLQKVNDTIAKFTLDAGANKNFVQGAIFAKTGKDATEEQLQQLAGKTLREVIEAIDLDVEEGGAVPVDQLDKLAGTGIKSGDAITDPEQLGQFKESDIARTTNGNIYRRDLAKEETLLKDFISKFGQPKTEADWKKFHDFVYEPGSLESKDLTTSTITDPAPTDTPTVTDPTGAPTDTTGGAGGTADTTTDVDPISKAYNDLIASKQDGASTVDLDPILASKQNAEKVLEEARQLIVDKQLLDAVELEGISKGQPIPMNTIRRQQQKFSQDEYIENLMNAQDYNNKLILSKLANGDLAEAQRINQQVADDNFQIATLQIDKMVAENAIDQQTADSYYKQSEHELDLNDLGYTPLSGDTLATAQAEFGNSRIWKDPVSGKSYLKPDPNVQAVDINDFQKSQLITQFMGQGFDLATAMQKASNVISGVGALNGSNATGNTPEITGDGTNGLPGGAWNTSSLPQGFRTDRHNNPTAFTTDIAVQAGLVEGVDYEMGDPFPDNPNMKTARLLGDGVSKTIQVIDDIGFYTQGGEQRWTHTALPDEVWHAMDDNQKRDVVKLMNQREGGSGSIFGESPSTTQPSTQPVTQPTQTFKIITPNEATKINKEIATSDAFKGLKAGQDSVDLLENYKKLVEKNGLQVFGKESQKQQTAYNSLLLNLKELFNLGVLNGPDLDLMESIIPKTTEFFGNVKNLIQGKGKQSALGAIDEAFSIFERQIDLKHDDLVNQFGVYDPAQLTNLKTIEDRFNNVKSVIAENKTTETSEIDDYQLYLNTLNSGGSTTAVIQ